MRMKRVAPYKERLLIAKKILLVKGDISVPMNSKAFTKSEEKRK